MLQCLRLNVCVIQASVSPIIEWSLSSWPSKDATWVQWATWATHRGVWGVLLSSDNWTSQVAHVLTFSGCSCLVFACPMGSYCFSQGHDYLWLKICLIRSFSQSWHISYWRTHTSVCLSYINEEIGSLSPTSRQSPRWLPLLLPSHCLDSWPTPAFFKESTGLQRSEDKYQ